MYGGGWVKYNKRLIRKLKGVVTNRRTALLGGFVNWSIKKWSKKGRRRTYRRTIPRQVGGIWAAGNHPNKSQPVSRAGG